MNRGLRMLVLALAAAALPAEAVSNGLVLVAGAHSPIARLSPEEARKLYLGVPVLVDGQPLQPMRNHTDPMTDEMFLQKVMFMSAQAYERQILGRVYRSGGKRPPAFTDSRDLVKALAADPMAVTYMQREAAAATPGVKIVGDP